MKKVKRTIIIALATAFVGTATLALASCVKEEDVNATVNGAVEPVKTQIESLNGAVDALDAKLAEVNDEIDALDGDLKTALEESKALFEGELDSVKAKIKALKETDDDIQTAVATLETKVATLEQGVQNLQSAVQAVTARVEQNEADIADILERLDALEKENAIMKACLNGEHEFAISYEWTELDCVAQFDCAHCTHYVEENSSELLDLCGYKEATFESEELEKQIYGNIEDAVIDYRLISGEKLEETVSYVLSLGGRNIHVILEEEASYAELYAIRLGIEGVEEVADESVHLTIAGILELPDHVENDETKRTFGFYNTDGVRYSFDKISTLTLPDATTVGMDSFHFSSLSTLVAPNLETVGERAFLATNLIELDLPKLTTVQAYAFAQTPIQKIKLPCVTTLEKFAFDHALDIESVELTATEIITVGENAFNPEYTDKIDLVLHAANGLQGVDGKTWTPRNSGSAVNFFLFKSITVLGGVHESNTNNYYAYSASGLQEWNEFAQEDLSINLVLKADIVLTGENNFKTIGINEETGIKESYNGTVDGEGHSITGLHIDRKAEAAAMIYKLHDRATVKNLILKNATIKAQDAMYVSAICGINNGTITDCDLIGNSTVSCTGEDAPDSYIGGIVGWNNGIIKECNNRATVTASMGDDTLVCVGGIVGLAGGTVEHCQNGGEIRANGSLSYAGGIAGRSNNGGAVIACHNENAVKSAYYVGGIVGEANNSTVTVCDNTATTVTGDYYVGGIAGAQTDSGKINGCWTVDGREISYGLEVTENKNGIGGEEKPEAIVACFMGDPATVNAQVATMNEAVQDTDYRWVENNGTHPLMMKLVEVKIALKEDAQTSVYYKDNLKVDLSTLLDITEGAGAVTYTLISAEGEIKGSVFSRPRDGGVRRSLGLKLKTRANTISCIP